MALARLALKNLEQRVPASASLLGSGGLQKQRFSAAAGETPDHGKEVAVSEGRKKSKLFPRSQRRWRPWRSDDRGNFVPALYEFFPSGLGNALMQATENINRLFENMNISPPTVGWRVKEKEGCYMLWFDVPGLAKEDLKVTVDDGVLTIKGERKEEKEEGSDEELWYGYYNTSLMLPDDAKVEEVKAELKDGVLIVTIPRTEKPKKDVKEVKVH
ncbi:26.5 kDa heat shock protein, mitochondrial [Corylus avellana]|uniref:26.5 kDa heat shock protein, mitochondrial n=1 Tax=Corylus avellana TaxID=13451 RepID=UPI001E1F3738|nr:26.5 kDa heat shock protein, mitochondrial [Corylus avellana]